VDEVSNVLLPRARAAVSLRLAPGDDAHKAQDALAEHLKANVPWGAKVTISHGHGMAEPFSLDATGSGMEDAAGRMISNEFQIPNTAAGSHTACSIDISFGAAGNTTSAGVTEVGDIHLVRVG
jgi:acetylornithine deacetylase/succinyl-diaminopimelate desuccinylase-like protein